MESPGCKYREEAQGQSPASLYLEGSWVEKEESIKMLPRWLSGKEFVCDAGDTVMWVQSLGRCPGGGNGNPLQYSCLGNPMERGIWRGLQFMGSKTAGHGEGNGNPLQCSCLENPRDGGASWEAIYGVAQGRTRLK